MESKKISFGFTKTAKKFNLINQKDKSNTKPKIDLIKCVEGQEIKLVKEIKPIEPLVVPLKENQKTPAALASLMRRRAVLLNEQEETTKTEEETNKTKSNVIEEKNALNNVNLIPTLEQRAVQELLANCETKSSTTDPSNLVLPLVKPDELPLDGAAESTLDDYQTIPVEEFGKAMLRGMGWMEPDVVKVKEDPPIRPKGMGLGADKALRSKQLLIPPEPNEILAIKRNAFVRILGGKFRDLYGQIEGFDDYAGRVIVKMAIGGAKEAFNEFLCQPVSSKEYSQYSKCLNNAKYNKYKSEKTENPIKIDNDISLKKEVKKEEMMTPPFIVNSSDSNDDVKKESKYLHSDSLVYKEQQTDKDDNEYNGTKCSKHKKHKKKTKKNKKHHKRSHYKLD